MRSLSWISPPPLIFLAWGVSIFFNVVVLGYGLSWGAYIYSYGIGVFLLTYAILHFSWGRRYDWPPQKKEGVIDSSCSMVGNGIVIKLYWIMSFLALIVIIYRLYTIGLNGAFDRFFLNLRHDISFGEGDIYHAAHLSLFPFSLCLYYCFFGKRALALLAGGVYLLGAISFAQRTSMFFLFCSMIFILYYRAYISVRTIAISFAFLIFLFVAVALGAGKSGGERGYEFISLYIGYGITSFGDSVRVYDSQGCGRLVFGIIYDFFMLGDSRACGVGRDIFYSNDIFNVYTYAASPFMFAGVGGVTVAMAFLAFVYFFLWNKCKVSRNGFFLAMMASYSYALLMVFYAWQFSLTTYYYIFILLIPLFFRFKWGRFRG